MNNQDFVTSPAAVFDGHIVIISSKASLDGTPGHPISKSSTTIFRFFLSETAKQETLHKGFFSPLCYSRTIYFSLHVSCALKTYETCAFVRKSDLRSSTWLRHQNSLHVRLRRRLRQRRRDRQKQL